MRKAIGILLMATLMAICFTATAAPALAGVSTTYINTDIALGHTQTMNRAGQEVSQSAAIAIGAGSSNINITDKSMIGAGSGDQRVAYSARSLGASPFRICS